MYTVNRVIKSRYLWASILFVIILFLSFFLEGCSLRSGIRIGYVGTETSKKWTGSYARLDGMMKKTMKVDNEALVVDITTNSGSIDIVIEDTEGNRLYKGTDLETCSFEVGASGSVKITINADKHVGSFSFTQKKDQ